MADPTSTPPQSIHHRQGASDEATATTPTGQQQAQQVDLTVTSGPANQQSDPYGLPLPQSLQHSAISYQHLGMHPQNLVGNVPTWPSNTSGSFYPGPHQGFANYHPGYPQPYAPGFTNPQFPNPFSHYPYQSTPHQPPPQQSATTQTPIRRYRDRNGERLLPLTYDQIEPGQLYLITLSFPDHPNQPSPLKWNSLEKTPLFVTDRFEVNRFGKLAPARIEDDKRRLAIVVEKNESDRSVDIMISSTRPRVSHRWIPFHPRDRRPHQPNTNVIIQPPQVHQTLSGYICFTHILHASPMPLYPGDGVTVRAGSTRIEKMAPSKSYYATNIEEILEQHRSYWWAKVPGGAAKGNTREGPNKDADDSMDGAGGSILGEEQEKERTVGDPDEKGHDGKDEDRETGAGTRRALGGHDEEVLGADGDNDEGDLKEPEDNDYASDYSGREYREREPNRSDVGHNLWGLAPEGINWMIDGVLRPPKTFARPSPTPSEIERSPSPFLDINELLGPNVYSDEELEEEEMPIPEGQTFENIESALERDEPITSRIPVYFFPVEAEASGEETVNDFEGIHSGSGQETAGYHNLHEGYSPDKSGSRLR